MAESIPFRSSMFGFHKKDVMLYIEKLQKVAFEKNRDAEDIDKEIAARDTKVIELNAEVDSCNTTIQQLRAQLEEKSGEIAALKQSLEEQQAANETLKNAEPKIVEKIVEKVVEKPNKVTEEAAARTKELEARIVQMEENDAKLKSIQAQIGSLMLDAQMYADKIVGQAETRVSDLTDEYQNTAKSVSGDIIKFTAEISDTAADITQSLDALTQRLLAVSNRLDLATPGLLDDVESFPQFRAERAQNTKENGDRFQLDVFDERDQQPAPPAEQDAHTTHFEINLDNLEISSVQSEKKEDNTAKKPIDFQKNDGSKFIEFL